MGNEFNAYDPAFTGGVYVAAGDLDGNGNADVVTGAGAGGGPHVRAFDAITLESLASFQAFDPAAEMFAGGVRVSTGDADGSRLADILVAPGPGRNTLIQSFSLDGTRIGAFTAFTSFAGGVFVASSPAQPGRSAVRAPSIAPEAEGHHSILASPGMPSGLVLPVYQASKKPAAVDLVLSDDVLVAPDSSSTVDDDLRPLMLPSMQGPSPGNASLADAGGEMARLAGDIDILDPAADLVQIKLSLRDQLSLAAEQFFAAL